MKINTFIGKLRHEAKTNPKQAGVLGLLLVVALWFWAPLLIKWIAPNSSATADTAPLEPAASPAADTPAATSASNTLASNKAKAMQYPWREISNSIESDPQMSPAAPAAATIRDPFKPLLKIAPPTPPAPKPVAKIVVPDSLDFKLSGTLIGSTRKTARINGKSYAEGDLLHSDAHPEVHFEVTEITGRKVTLERLGQTFELKIKSQQSADKSDTTNVDR